MHSREPNGGPGRLAPVHAPIDHAPVRAPSIPAADIDARPDFTAFYRRSYRKIAAALSTTLRDQDVGTEAADEAMARCYARWATVGTYDNPEGWVYRVGLNWALSWHRKLVRHRTLPEPEPVQPRAPVDPQIEKALADLDLRLRSVVVCRILLDWSTDETAAALGLKPGTVKSRLHRGLGRLAETLSHFNGSY